MPRFAPTAWTPPSDVGLVGDFAENHDLAVADLWPTGGQGPEDIVIDHLGRVVAGLDDGQIVRFDPSGRRARTIASTGGRPLGIELHPEDGYIICDAYKGLLHLTSRGDLIVLANSYGGLPFGITNNAAVRADGTIYFSVSSHKWTLADFTADLLERSATGRVYRRDPSGELSVLMDGLVFPNGVTLTPDERSLLVAETGSYRIHKVSVDGPGEQTVILHNLPGFPDNLSTDATGIIWCGVPRPRDRLLDATLPRPWMRRAIHSLPASLQPKPSRHGLVIGFDSGGKIVHNLQDPGGRVAVTTSARRHGDRLFVGSLSEPAIAVLSL